MAQVIYRFEQAATEEGNERVKKNMFKLMNIAVFGKTIENIRNIKLSGSENMVEEVYNSNPEFKNCTNLNEIFGNWGTL